jgi:hypothetical protein
VRARDGCGAGVVMRATAYPILIEAERPVAPLGAHDG